jgi:hypothetical protein
VPGAAEMRCLVSRPSSSELLIEVVTGEAHARIAAREHMRMMQVVVRRFKNEKILFDGSGATDLEMERVLGSLLTDLSASPFV